MADFLEQKKQEIAARLKDLKPAVDEYQRLEEALRALDGAGTRTPSTPSTPARGGRRRAASTASTGTRRRGRPRGTGTRAAQTLDLVKATPGITIPELADKMGIKQNYLYRVLPTLEADKKVRKDGRGWVPVKS